MFGFTRTDTRTDAEFAQHYVSTHAPLALRSCPAMRSYTVNLVDLASAPSPPAGHRRLNALTVIDVDDAAGFFGASSFTSQEARAEMMADHDSFIGPMAAWQVEPDAANPFPVDPSCPTPMAKVVALFDRSADDMPDDIGVAHVRRHRVVRAMTPQAEPWLEFVELWGPNPRTLIEAAVGAWVLPVSEYRFA